MTTWSAMPAMRAGPDTHGPTMARITGTTPEASDRRAATRPQAWSEAIPSCTSAPELETTPTTGTPESTASLTTRSMASPSGGPNAPRCLPPSRRNSPTARPSSSPRAASTAAPRPAPMVAGGVTRSSAIRCSGHPQPGQGLTLPNPLARVGEKSHQAPAERAVHGAGLTEELEEPDGLPAQHGAGRQLAPFPGKGLELSRAGGHDHPLRDRELLAGICVELRQDDLLLVSGDGPNSGSSVDSDDRGRPPDPHPQCRSWWQTFSQ